MKVTTRAPDCKCVQHYSLMSAKFVQLMVHRYHWIQCFFAIFLDCLYSVLKYWHQLYECAALGLECNYNLSAVWLMLWLPCVCLRSWCLLCLISVLSALYIATSKTRTLSSMNSSVLNLSTLVLRHSSMTIVCLRRSVALWSIVALKCCLATGSTLFSTVPCDKSPTCDIWSVVE